MRQQQVSIAVSAEVYGDADSPEERRSCEVDFWEGHSAARRGQDKVGAEVAAAISAIEGVLIPLLRSEIHHARVPNVA
jgi:hypothetical protein